MKPKMFIASSVEGLSVARSIQENLDHEVESTVWEQGVFKLSHFTIDDLVESIGETDFCSFVFTPDDEVIMREEEYKTVRDNVLFELGVAIGTLGRKRCFIVAPRNKKNFHFPTDLLGISFGDYEADRADENLVAALGSSCNKIRRIIKELGVATRQQDPLELTTDKPQTIEKDSSPKRKPQPPLKDLTRAFKKELEKIESSDQQAFNNFEKNPTHENLIKILKRALTLNGISEEGVRIHIRYTNIYLRFLCNYENNVISLFIENASCKSLAKIEWRHEESTIDILKQLVVVLQKIGEYPSSKSFDPENLFQEIINTLKRVIDFKSGLYTYPKDIGPVIQIPSENWVITTFGLEAIEPSYFIAAKTLGESDWPSHMKEKTWVDFDNFYEAFLLAQAVHRGKYQ